jgi:WD40 repeat protein
MPCDVANKKEIASIPFCGKRTLAFVPEAERFFFLNGRYVKTPGKPLTPFVHYYKAYNGKGKFLYEIATNHHIVRHTVLSPDQKLLLSADLLGNINLFNVATGKIQRTLKNKPFDYMNTVAFMPDGKQFAVGGSGGQVAFYDTASGKQLKVLKVLKSEMIRMTISPDGRWLVAAGSGEQVRHLLALRAQSCHGLNPIYSSPSPSRANSRSRISRLLGRPFAQRPRRPRFR